MGRIEKLEKERKYKRRYFVVLLLAISLIVLGIGYADYSLNGIMDGKKQVRVASFDRKQSNYIKVCFLGGRFYINTKYIERDMSKLKKVIINAADNIKVKLGQ